MSGLFSVLLNVAVIVFAVSSMLSAGAGSHFREIVLQLRDVGALLRVLVANFVLVPLLALLVLALLDPPQALAVGVFLVATAAGAPFLIKLAAVAEADLTLSAAALLVLLPATIVYMPLVVPLALPRAEISAAAIAQPLLLTMLVPLGAGLLLRSYAEPWALALQQSLSRLSSIALAVVIAATVLANLSGILTVFGTSAIPAAVIVVVGAFSIGYLLGGPGRARREVLGLATSQRNISAAAVVATQATRDPNTITMVVVSSLIGFVILFPVAAFLRRRPPEPIKGAKRRRESR